MGIYNKYVLPRLIHFTCGMKPVMKQRQKVVPLAEGRVLEVGIGTGLNLPYYDAEKVEGVVGLDPSPDMNRLALQAADEAAVDVELLTLPGEEIPVDSNSIDTVLITYTLCTIPDPVTALHQMARVLKTDGRLIFCEHGAAPDASVRRWQNRLDGFWGKIGGGCHLNREIPQLIESGEFRIGQLDSMYIPGWKPACFNYWGTATVSSPANRE